MGDDFLKHLMGLYSSQTFKDAFQAFFMKMQEDGLESAKKSWDVTLYKSAMKGGGTDLFEKMIDFYSDLGFVSKKKHEAVLKENEELKKENAFLKGIVQNMNLRVFEDGSKNIQETWKETIEKQMELSKDIAKNFFDLFKK
ncbi:MAG: hypothetical protein HQL03_11550 [Nitrospirae bacterium]|nr:hypothetical protein [Nitrospirota bacterium]MBF0592885.1 hypothetical protein [Nitrospirota bacterium]